MRLVPKALRQLILDPLRRLRRWMGMCPFCGEGLVRAELVSNAGRWELFTWCLKKHHLEVREGSDPSVVVMLDSSEEGMSPESERYLFEAGFGR